MAWTFVSTTDSLTNKTGGVADVAVGVNADVGDILIACAACDNSSVADPNETGSFTDASGNTWTRGNTKNNTASSATKVAVAFYSTEVTTAIVSAAVTYTPGQSVAAKAFTVYRFTGGTATNVGTPNNTADGVTSISLAWGVGTTDDLLIGATANEDNESASYTFDTDTDGGSWSTGVKNGTDSGGSASNITVLSQYKIMTSTANQTWNLTFDSADTTMILTKFAAPSVSSTPIASKSIILNATAIEYANTF